MEVRLEMKTRLLTLQRYVHRVQQLHCRIVDNRLAVTDAHIRTEQDFQALCAVVRQTPTLTAVRVDHVDLSQPHRATSLAKALAAAPVQLYPD